MIYQTLYGKDSKGKIRIWQIEIEKDKYRTISGLLDGKRITSNWTTVQETNVGKINHRDTIEQAKFEMDSCIKKQIEQENYRESIEELNSIDSIFECMLAQDFNDRKNEIQYPVYCQKKLDGIRMNVSQNSMLSRNRKEFVSVPHLEYLKDFCKKYNLILDGELYNHEFKDDFNSITSIVKKTKPKPEDVIKSKQLIQYWIYDCYFIKEPDLKFIDRFEKLQHLMKSDTMNFAHTYIVQTNRCDSIRDLDFHYEKFISEGFEGQMVRVNMSYENKRSKYLLKRKEFMDKEFKVIDVCEGNGNKSNMAGYMVLQNDDGTRFKSNIKGSHDLMKEYLINKFKIIGKQATCKFFNLTPDGVPRFPYVIQIRDYE
jgi:DNA ligase-1